VDLTSFLDSCSETFIANRGAQLLRRGRWRRRAVYRGYNSAFDPSGVGKSNTTRPYVWLGLRRDVFTCVGWKVTLRDPIWQVTPRSCEMGSINSYLGL